MSNESVFYKLTFFCAWGRSIFSCSSHSRCDILYAAYVCFLYWEVGGCTFSTILIYEVLYETNGFVLSNTLGFNLDIKFFEAIIYFPQHDFVLAFQGIVYHGMKAIRWKHIACALGIAVHKPHLTSEIWYNTFGSMKKHLALKWEIGYESLCTNTKCLGIFCPCQTIIFLSSVYLQLMIEFQPPKNPISALCMYPQYTQLLPVHTAACTAKLISSL